MIIRDARPADAEELWRLNELFNGSGTSDLDSVRRALEASNGEIVLVAEEGESLAGFLCGRVTGSVCYPQKTAEVAELFVEDRFRRKGVAAALMREAEARFRALGAGEFRLYTGTWNRAARAFYEKIGYSSSEEIMYTKVP